MRWPSSFKALLSTSNISSFFPSFFLKRGSPASLWTWPSAVKLVASIGCRNGRTRAFIISPADRCSSVVFSSLGSAEDGDELGDGDELVEGGGVACDALWCWGAAYDEVDEGEDEGEIEGEVTEIGDCCLRCGDGGDSTSS
jgi:hypothetical protein